MHALPHHWPFDRLSRVVLALALVVLMVATCPVIAQVGGDDDAAASPATDASVASLYDDFVHFAMLGRFDVAEAYGSQLLGHADLDPVALLDVAERNRGSVDTLLMLIEHSEIADRAQQVLDVIRKGEHEKRRDPSRIRQNIEKLGGPPQTEYNAIQRLRDSGEHAVPWMLDVLTKSEDQRLRPRIVRALPKIGQAAVNPLVIALEIDQSAIEEIAARALGQIGYAQAIPYLEKLQAREGIADEVKRAATEAIAAIQQRAGRRLATTRAADYVQLAEQYYVEHGSVKADPRSDRANLWFVRDGFLTPVAVPTEIYGPVMAMRCCEEALLAEPNRTDAIALWLAANIRREARLGMNVESGEKDANAGKDPSAPDDFPRSVYFTRAAGPLYAQLVLERAVRDRDAQVALGAIAALRVTAGELSLVGREDYKQPLVQALRFPDRLVRIKAALALAAALPKSPFDGMDLVPRVLADALRQRTKPRYVVVDPDENNLNRVVSDLRGTGPDVLGDKDFYAAAERTRKELDGVSCLFVATDVGGAGLTRILRQLRDDPAFAMTPIVLLTKPEHVSVAEEFARTIDGLEQVDAGAGVSDLADAVKRAYAASGQAPLDDTLALQLALETAGVLGQVAVNGRTVIRYELTEPALIEAINGENEELRVASAFVLAHVPSAGAQRALARTALDSANVESLRVALFGALAESAKRNANQLDSGLIDELVKVAADEPDLTLRTAASQALGALNLTTNKASEIIRKYYQG